MSAAPQCVVITGAAEGIGKRWLPHLPLTDGAYTYVM